MSDRRIVIAPRICIFKSIASFTQEYEIRNSHRFIVSKKKYVKFNDDIMIQFDVYTDFYVYSTVSKSLMPWTES